MKTSNELTLLDFHPTTYGVNHFIALGCLFVLKTEEDSFYSVYIPRIYVNSETNGVPNCILIDVKELVRLQLHCNKITIVNDGKRLLPTVKTKNDDTKHLSYFILNKPTPDRHYTRIMSYINNNTLDVRKINLKYVSRSLTYSNILHDGKVRYERATASGERHITRLLKKGEHIGYLAFIKIDKGQVSKRFSFAIHGDSALSNAVIWRDAKIKELHSKFLPQVIN